MRFLQLNPYKLILSLILSFLPATKVLAGDKPIRLVASPVLEGWLTGVGASHTVALPTINFFTQYDDMALGMVKMLILPNKSYFNSTQQNFNLEVDVTVECFDYNAVIYNTTGVQSNHTLRINHKPYNNSPYKDQDYIIFNNLSNPKTYKLVTTINSIRLNGITVTNLPGNVRIESSIDYLRYTYFNPNLHPTNLLATLKDFDCNSNYENIEFSWTPLAGATHYELEWSFRDNYTSNSGQYQNAGFGPNAFYGNSTRIVTTNNSYIIPNIFPQGTIGYRIRAFGRQTNFNATSLSPEISGVWTPMLNFMYPSILVGHFESNKNWQYQMTFAEDGKNKSVVNFADGSLRSRQTITQNNSDHTTIVGQTIYDFTGRPAVTVLPAPIPNPICSTAAGNAQNSFKYISDFNKTPTQGFNGATYSKYHFDINQSPSSCSNIYVPMAPTSGASKYYSPNNLDQNAQQAFVPDAGGFPYSQVEYTGDNTGRIKRQGGVGQEFQINSGKDSKYFYGTPEQIELDRLFGSEVGDASHYQKNMVIDPNGQVSISYIDMNGKTIATSLAGDAPSNLENMVTQPGLASTLKADMFNKNSQGISKINVVGSDSESIVFTKSFLVNTNNSPNTITYSLAIKPFTLSCVAGLCFNCIYDLELKITDDCGAVVYSSPNSGKRMIGNFTTNGGGDTIFDVSCTYPNPFQFNLSTPASPLATPITLNPGVYYLSKTLRVSKDARDFYLKKYLDKNYNTCINDFNGFVNAELNKITDSTDCGISCDTCFSKLGTKDSYVSKGRGTEEEWAALYDKCKELCNYTKTNCELSLNMLMADVSPNGQYGSWTNPFDKLSVYNPNNYLPKNVNSSLLPGAITPNYTAFWQKPMLPSGLPHYLDNNGQRARIKLSKLPPNTTINPGDYNLRVGSLALTFTLSAGNYYTYPENLYNLSDFVSLWQPSWAKSLVTYHPEYCYYQDCIDKFGAVAPGSPLTMTSNDFDATLLNTGTFADAISSGLLIADPNHTSPQGYMLKLVADPANQTGYFGTAYTSSQPLVDAYTTYNISMGPLSMSEYVSYVLKCANQLGSNQTNLAPCLTFGNSSSSTSIKNQEWNTLKGLYLSEKNKIMTRYSDFARSSSTCNYYNTCIGNPAFNGYSSPLVQYIAGNNSPNPSSPYFQSNQPCNLQMKDLYAAKSKRFGLANTPNNTDQDEAEYQLYLQTGKCPIAFDFQNLVDALAKNFKLNALTEPLQNYPELSLNLYNHFNGLPNPPTNYVNFLWLASVTSNILSVDIKNAFTGSIVKSITFNPPTSGTINWNNVSRITQLMVTGNSGSAWTFTCIAKEMNGTSYSYKTISGSTNIKLGGCIFKDVCKPNDLALQLQSLMSALKTNPGFSNADLFSTSPVILGSPSSNNLYGPALQKIKSLIAANTTNPNFRWIYQGNMKFEVFDVNNSACKIQINLLSISPGVLSTALFNQVTSFVNIKSDYNNFFTFEARGVTNNLIGTIRGEVFKSCVTKVALSMGNCGKPDPAECKTKQHETKKHLEELFTDILINKRYSPTVASPNNNVLSYASLNSNLTSSFVPLASNIPVVKYNASNHFYQTFNQGFETGSTALPNDSLSFTFVSPCAEETEPIELIGGGCAQYSYCSVWLKTNNKGNQANPPQLAKISKIIKMAGYGNTSSSGSYTDFYIVVEYDYCVGSPITAGGGGGGELEGGGGIGSGDTYNSNCKYIDTLYGKSCFEIKNCEACGENSIKPCCGSTPQSLIGGSGDGARLIQTNFFSGDPNKILAVAKGLAVIDSSAKMYTEYLLSIEKLNKRLGYNKEDNHFILPEGIAQFRKVEYADAATYFIKFINGFNPAQDSKTYLTDVTNFIAKNDFFKTINYAYVKYINEVNRYNMRAEFVSAKSIDVISVDDFKKTEANKSSFSYINYLRSFDATSVEPPVALTQSRNQPNSLSRNSTPNAANSLTNKCDSLYQAYLNAFNYFITNNTNCGSGYSPLSQTDFQNKNYCCERPGFLNFTQYISSFYNQSTCPQAAINTIDGCDNPAPLSYDDCANLYQTYLSTLAQFNESDYAINNNRYLASPFENVDEFYNLGYCKCVQDYLAYLNHYLSTQVSPDLAPPASIKDFSGCGQDKYCEKEFNEYIAAMTAYADNKINHPELNLPDPQVMYTIAMFTKEGFCNCVKPYNSFLLGVANGSVKDINYINSHINIEDFCHPTTLPCVKPSTIDTVESPVDPNTSQNPCTKYKKELAKINAKLLFNQDQEAKAAIFIRQYNAHCLKAVEGMYREYSDKEFHQTLYYYDQAGNLIKTIPPAGIDQTFFNSIKNYNDPNELKVKMDRSSRSKSVIVDHAQVSNYVYNTLNQLIKQKIPDHEAISSNNLSYKEVVGLDPYLDVVSSQFIDQNKGYLAANQKLSNPYFTGASSIIRGQVFESSNGGDNWKSQTNIIGADIKEIEFLNLSGNVYGFAVGTNGAFMVSLDGGTNWQQYPIHDFTNGETLNDLKVMQSISGTNIEGVLVGNNGTVIRMDLSTAGNPSFAKYNQTSSGSFGVTNDITDIAAAIVSGSNEYYITVLDKTNNSNKIYKGLCTTANPNWIDISGTQVLELNKVRNLNGGPTAYAVGKDGTLLKSNVVTGIETWNIKKTGTSGNILDAYFATSNIGVAVIEDNSGIGSLYKTTDGGTSWLMFNQGTSTMNFRSLSPYYTNSNIHRLTANGSNFLVKRVTIDFTSLSNPAIGAVSTMINTGNQQQINDVAVLPYGNGSRYFALAAGQSGDIFYSTDYQLNNVTWKAAFSVSGTAKKVVMNFFNGTTSPNLEGVILLDGIMPNGGKPIGFNSTAFNLSNMAQSVTWSAADISAWSSPHNSTSYSDLVYDPNAANPNSSAYLIGYNASLGTIASTINLMNVNSTYVSIGPDVVSPVTNNLSKLYKSMAVNAATGKAWVVGVNGNLSTISSAVTPFAGAITYNDNTTKAIPYKINDIAISGTKIRVVGDDGFVAEALTSSNPFKMINTGLAENINALQFCPSALTSNTNGKEMLMVGDNGLVCYATVSGNNLVSNNYNVTTENLNDVCVNESQSTAPDVYFVGNNGSIIYSDMSVNSPLFTPVFANTDQNINCLAYASAGTNILSGGNNMQSFYLGNTSSLQNSNWFTNEITQLHFTDADNGYIVGKKGLIKHTSNGGLNWQSVKPYLNPSTTPPSAFDLFSVYTTAPDTAIIGGNLNYFSNLAGLTIAAPLSFNASSTKAIYDIDLYDETHGYFVGTDNAGTSAAIASAITILNNQATAFTILNPPSSFDGFKSLYAFKNTAAGRFLAVGKNATISYYNNNTSNFSTAITYASGTSFLSTDNFNTVTFADNTDGFIGGTGTKLATVRVDHTTPGILVANKNTLPTTNATNITLNEIKTISITDDGGISAFIGGNFNNTGTYAWKFGQQAGKYSDLFWYDRLGRLTVSQNAEQAPNRYSYTLYDALGRIEEVGEKTENITVSQQFQNIFGTMVNNSINTNTIDDAKFYTWVNDVTGARKDVTHTYYDNSLFSGAWSGMPYTFNQQNLRKRVASITVEANYDGVFQTFDHGTHYTYDVSGNVKAILQDNQKLSTIITNLPPERFKLIDYDYDLISGKVNQVSFQRGSPDAYYHQYEYDADNRLTEVKTSRNGLVWETDAKYFYYKHGPLARVEYGHDKVQGIDYAYTLQGWIKGVNSNKLVPANDIGGDALPGSSDPNHLFGRDAMGYTLGYYKTILTDDYKPINAAAWTSSNKFEASIGNSGSPSTVYNNRNNLFNGNISFMATTITEPNTNYGSTPVSPGYVLAADPIINAYKYDQLNRLTTSHSYTNFVEANNDWFGTGINRVYTNKFTYDANGNILSQTKRDQHGVVFDSLTYNYNYDAQNRPINNKLTEYAEHLGSGHDGDKNYDLDVAGVIANNYNYDKIGNMMQDWKEDIQNGGIKWNVYGKISSIIRNPSSTKPNLKFDYDAQGNRIAKHLHNASNDSWYASTYYVRDAQGNVMATYERYKEVVGGTFVPNLLCTEHPIYGSSRIGIDKYLIPISSFNFAPTSSDYERIVGNKHFELSNHLGNINAVVSDLKVPVEDGVGGIAYYLPDLVSTTDYYAFGQPMEGRQYSNGSYRYGFNGKEKDDEIKGSGNSLDYGARIYDPRLGRWLGVDPLNAEYTSISPYVFAVNSPISAFDQDGKRVYFVGGAGGDTKGWNYTERWGNAFTNNGIQGFTPLKNTSHDLKGSFPLNDILFTNSYRKSTTKIEPTDFGGRGSTKIVALNDKMIDKAVNQIIDDLTKNPLKEGEQLNLAGYSYGSVLQAHVVLALSKKGVKVDNLILIGSPIPSKSELFESLSKVTNVIREDIKGDKLSDDKEGINMLTGAHQNIGDEGPHFDLARPGKDADKAIDSKVKDIKSKGVK
jgi:RHS repeat-associated protein